MFNIGILNESKKVGSDQIAGYLKGLQAQIDSHFSRIWGVDAILTFPPAPYKYQSQIFPLHIQDAADVAGVLGYHDIDADGLPYMKVFVNESAAAGVSLSSVMSHEILEVLGDPFVASSVFIPTSTGGGWIYAAEVCDPVEQDSYKVHGVEVSNFITPYWFIPQIKGKPVDFMGKLKDPFTISPGGYFEYMDVTGSSGWKSIQGRKFQNLFDKDKK